MAKTKLVTASMLAEQINISRSMVYYLVNMGILLPSKEISSKTMFFDVVECKKRFACFKTLQKQGTSLREIKDLLK